MSILAWILSVAGALFTTWFSLWMAFYPGDGVSPVKAAVVIASFAITGMSPGALVGLSAGSRPERLIRFAIVFGAVGIIVGHAAKSVLVFLLAVVLGLIVGRLILGPHVASKPGESDPPA